MYSGVTAEMRGGEGVEESGLDSGSGRMCEDEKSQNKGVRFWFPSSPWESERRRRMLAGLMSPWTQRWEWRKARPATSEVAR